MLKSFEISGYKSLAHLKLDLGRINVFIGENGAGKTNILEGLAFVAAVLADKTENEELMARGVRVARPEITLSAFRGGAVPEAVTAEFETVGDLDVPCKISIEARPESADVGGWRDVKKPTLPIGVSIALLAASAESLSLGGALLDAMTEATSGRPVDAQTKNELAAAARSIFKDYNHSIALRLTTLTPFAIYSPNSLALRGLQAVSHRTPIGIYGEDLDVAFAALPDQLRADIIKRAQCIEWFADAILDPKDDRRRKGAKPGRSRSRLYFRDRYMTEANAEFAAENANEGILYLMFYLTLFSSPYTPKLFGIDNIETALNPQLCRELIAHLAVLAKQHDKQALITTHNPAVLDGLDLGDDDQRLFVVERNDDGHTVARRIMAKPASPTGGSYKLKLSEMWMRGLLGGIPERF